MDGWTEGWTEGPMDGPTKHSVELHAQKTELNELESSKTLSEMNSCAHKHVFLYMHTQINLNTLLY